MGLGLERRLDYKVVLLSGGQRQALTMIMVTMVEPAVLLLDEHTAALHPKTARQVLYLIRDGDPQHAPRTGLGKPPDHDAHEAHHPGWGRTRKGGP